MAKPGLACTLSWLSHLLVGALDLHSPTCLQTQPSRLPMCTVACTGLGCPPASFLTFTSKSCVLTGKFPCQTNSVMDFTHADGCLAHPNVAYV